MQLGQIVVYVTDFEQAVAFYKDKLGLTMQFKDDYGIASFDAGGVSILVHDADGLDPRPPLPCFYVDDIDAAAADLKARGVNVGAISREEWGSKASFADPSGNALCIERHAEQPASV
jgi:predicted enzyme related to lactoylglutathione lyase